MPDPRVSQDAVEIIEKDASDPRISQDAVEMIQKFLPPTLVSQNVVEIVARNFYLADSANIFVVT